MCPAVSVCWLTEINSNQEDECGHVTRPDIIVPDVNHLTTSNQELHPSYTQLSILAPTVLCLSSLAQQFTDPGCQIYQSNTIVNFCTEGVKYIFYKVA